MIKFKMSDIVIKDIYGVEFDKIIGFVADNKNTTVKYILNGNERTVSIESKSVIICINKSNEESEAV